jgi:hypothetical protein
VLYCILLCHTPAVLWYAVPYCTILCCTVMCYTVLNMLYCFYCTILCVYHTLPYHNVLSCVILHCVVPHRTLLFKCLTVIMGCTVLCRAFTIGYITTLHCAALCWMWCRTILYFPLLFCMAPLYGIPHCAIYPLCYYLCHIDLYCAVVYSIVLYSTVLFCSLPNGWQCI